MERNNNRFCICFPIQYCFYHETFADTVSAYSGAGGCVWVAPS